MEEVPKRLDLNPPAPAPESTPPETAKTEVPVDPTPREPTDADGIDMLVTESEGPESAPVAKTPPPWEPKTWSETHGIDPPTRALLEKCKTPEEAMAVLGKRHQQLLSKLDEQGAELGQARRLLRMPSPTAPVPTPSVQPTATAADVQAFLSPEDQERFLDWRDRDPVGAEQWMYRTFILPEILQRVREDSDRREGDRRRVE